MIASKAFAEIVATTTIPVHACAIMRNHVHIVVGRHDIPYERMANRLKGRSSQLIRTHRGLTVAENRGDRIPVWTQGYWVKYIDALGQMECVIEYVNQNPIDDGLGIQKWSFVEDFIP
jgi:REP element-mobilizing transposase RayT